MEAVGDKDHKEIKEIKVLMVDHRGHKEIKDQLVLEHKVIKEPLVFKAIKEMMVQMEPKEIKAFKALVSKAIRVIKDSKVMMATKAIRDFKVM